MLCARAAGSLGGFFGLSAALRWGLSLDLDVRRHDHLLSISYQRDTWRQDQRAGFECRPWVDIGQIDHNLIRNIKWQASDLHLTPEMRQHRIGALEQVVGLIGK